jgi:hypothetical protein
LRAGRARFLGQTAATFRMWSVSPLPLLEMLGMEPFDHGAVTQEPMFERTTRMENARTLRAAIIEGENRSAPPGDAAVTLVALINASCDATKHEDLWLSSLHTVAEQSLAYLDSADATSLVDSVLPMECAARMSPRLQVWTDLYRAVAARDAQGMVDHGEAALQQAQGIDDGRLFYALSAAMLGHVVTHRPDRALQLWRDRPEPLQRLAATPDVELVIRVAAKRLADGVLVSQAPATL